MLHYVAVVQILWLLHRLGAARWWRCGRRRYGPRCPHREHCTAAAGLLQAKQCRLWLH